MLNPNQSFGTYMTSHVLSVPVKHFESQGHRFLKALFFIIDKMYNTFFQQRF